MKVDGHPELSELRSKLVTVTVAGNPVGFKVCSVPWRVSERIERLFPFPSPPLSFHRGGKVAKNAQGRPNAVPNPQDPSYVAKRNETLKWRLGAMFYEGLRTDATITWDSEEPEKGKDDDKAMATFYKAIAQEIMETGLTAGVVLQIVNEVNAMSDLTDDLIKRGMEDFTQPGM